MQCHMKIGELEQLLIGNFLHLEIFKISYLEIINRDMCTAVYLHIYDIQIPNVLNNSRVKLSMKRSDEILMVGELHH